MLPDTRTFYSLPAVGVVTIGRIRVALVALTAVLSILAAGQREAAARAAPESFADLVEGLLPAVVNIATTQQVEGSSGSGIDEFLREYFERRGEQPDGPPPPRQQFGQGSGFIIDPSGYVVTNFHVVRGASEVKVLLHDDTTLDAQVIGTDEETDLALLKIETTRALAYVSWGDSDKLRIGDWVIAIGNPFGLGGTVTAGIVSGRARDINSGPYDDFIQTDAAINQGNSGGPMFDISGKVVGVNTAIVSPSGGSVGIGFAIPANIARNVVNQLRETGTVKRGWLGVRIQTVTDELAEGLKLDRAYGALVASVIPGGPAEAAGIEQGDVIIEFDDREVPEQRQLPRMVGEVAPGKPTGVVVWRKGKRVELSIMLGERPSQEQLAAVGREGENGATEPSNRIDEIGIALSLPDSEITQRFGLDESTQGVVVTEVDPKGTASEKLRPGDLILSVDQEDVSQPQQVVDKVNRAKKDGARVVTMLIQRGGETNWVAIRLGG